MSDPEFRKYFTNTADYTVRMNSKKKILDKAGTIRLPGTRKSGEDHFISFVMYPERIDVFDPADPSSRYGTFLTDRVKNKIASLSARPVRVLNCHPQCHDGDTFCQTWSLAWLDKNLRKHVVTGCGDGGHTAIHKICRLIANSKKFSEYMLYPPNAASFQKILNNTTTVDFVEMSKRVTLEQIRDIINQNHRKKGRCVPPSPSFYPF